MNCQQPYDYNRPDIIQMWSPLDFERRHQQSHQHRPKIRNVAEVEQTSEIRDNFGVMRFKVLLQRAFPQIDEPSCSIDLEEFKDKRMHCGFEVVVISYMYDAEGTILVDDEFGRLDIATRAYEDNVKKYSLIAQVETGRTDDIKIYADKIGYHLTTECCANCRWGCYKNKKLVCSNWKQFAKRISDLQCPETQ